MHLNIQLLIHFCWIYCYGVEINGASSNKERWFFTNIWLGVVEEDFLEDFLQVLGIERFVFTNNIRMGFVLQYMSKRRAYTISERFFYNTYIEKYER